MKKKSLSIVMSIVMCMVLSFISCNTNKSVQNDYSMEYALDTIVDIHYIDSVCVADTLANYPDNWVWSPLRGYETKKDISVYGYMKASNWTFYRIIKEDDKYRLTKRIMK